MVSGAPELPLAMQTKLLHVIEAKQVRPVGSDQVQKVDVRIIAATNRDLPQLIGDGRFREDLYFRLSVFQIRMPPLRERRADIAGLIRFVLSQHHSSGAPLEIDPEAEKILINCDWPGNVRQLENALQRASILADRGRIGVGDLPIEITQPGAARGHVDTPAMTSGTLRECVRAYELKLIQQAIEDAGGDRRLAAQRLGIGVSSLYRKLEELPSEVSP